MKWGTTYSHRHLQSIGIDPFASLSDLFSFEFDVVRLCCYWDEIEPDQGTYDFSFYHTLLTRFEKQGQSVVMTIGMKAPRWPEYYIPSWTSYNEVVENSDEVMKMIDACIHEFSSYSCIKYWQVENEALDPSGPQNWIIPEHILEEEIKLVHSLDSSRPIIGTAWGNELKRRGHFPFLSLVSDIVGIDMYYKVPATRFFFIGPMQSTQTTNTVLSSSPKEVWIAELQAEPWENGNIFDPSFQSRSMRADILRENIENAKQFKVSTILLWGYEYWVHRKSIGDDSLWKTVKEIIQRA
jgi:hypothetical protein